MTIRLNLSRQPGNGLVRSLRDWRTARASQRVLLRELREYNSVAEIDDLLAVLARDESRESDAMRNVLLTQRSAVFRVA